MTAIRHGIFNIIDPPSDEAVDLVRWTIDHIDFPWDRLDLVREPVDISWIYVGWGAFYRPSSDKIELGVMGEGLQFLLAHEIGHLVDWRLTKGQSLRRARVAMLMHRISTDGAAAFPHSTPHNEDWHGVSDGHPFNYSYAITEAWADLFVATFAPEIWERHGYQGSIRFAHWTNDYARVRSIVLDTSKPDEPAPTPEPEPTPTPEPEPAPAVFPNDTIYRLYRAYFLREPDKGGYDYWKAQVATGVTYQAIADWFSVSPEFRATYGHLNDTEFVTLVYRNVLGREPDRSGRAYWVGVLASHSRGDVMLAFSESPEFVSKVEAERG